MLPPYYNTPEGEGQLRAIDERHHVLLRAARRDLVATVRAWRDYRRERFTAPGLEGLTRGANTYCFDDSGRLLHAAAGTLSDSHIPQTRRPRAALDALAKAYGWRHLRAVDALQDALEDARVPAHLRDQLRQHCAEFESDFLAKLLATDLFNDRGQMPAAAADVVGMLVRETLYLCDWLDLTAEANRAPMLRSELWGVLDILAAVGD